VLPARAERLDGPEFAGLAGRTSRSYYYDNVYAPAGIKPSCPGKWTDWHAFESRTMSHSSAQQTDKSHGGVPGLGPRLGDEDRRRRGESGPPGTAVITKTKPQTKRPHLYRVLLLNDDYTPMEFVVHVLERFFNKDRETATRIMLHVHNHGIGECGVFTYEVAETKVTQVMDFSRKHQHPLQCVMEKK
jgi:ATP-dependent Clp protease adaptor protein ClpS